MGCWHIFQFRNKLLQQLSTMVNGSNQVLDSGLLAHIPVDKLTLTTDSTLVNNINQGVDGRLLAHSPI